MSMNTAIYRVIANIINAILGIIALFLIVDVILKFFSANQAAPIVAGIYAVSNFLMSPFAGIVPNISVSTGVLDTAAVISLIFYVAVSYLLLSLIQSFIQPTVTEEEYSEEEYPGTAHYHSVRKEKKVRKEA